MSCQIPGGDKCNHDEPTILPPKNEETTNKQEDSSSPGLLIGLLVCGGGKLEVTRRSGV